MVVVVVVVVVVSSSSSSSNQGWKIPLNSNLGSREILYKLRNTLKPALSMLELEGPWSARTILNPKP